MALIQSPKRGAEAQYVRGVAALGIAAVLSKLLGTLQKIPLQNFAGDGVFGIYNAVYPLYTVILIMATAGFPVAVSKYIAEAKASGKSDREIQRLLYMAAVLLSLAGLAGFMLLFFGASSISRWIGHSGTEPAIRSISYSLLIIPVLAALRGYFQGLHDMIPTSVTQVIEQLVRVATIFGLLFYGLSWGASDTWIAAGATFGSVTGATAALIVILLYRRRERTDYQLAWGWGRADFWRGAKNFSLYSLSVSLGMLAMPLLNLADVFTVPRLLVSSGYSAADAMVWFGVYSRGLPLIQLVVMIAASISVAVIPAIADAMGRNDRPMLRNRAESAVQGAWVIGLASSFGMLLLAGPLNHMFYTDGAGTTAMAVIGFSSLFGTVYVMSSSVLQGIGAERLPVIHLLLATVFKLVLNLWAVPRFGIDGAAASTVAAYAAACLLNMYWVRRLSGSRYSLLEYVIKPLAAIGVMAIVVEAVRYGLESMLGYGPIGSVSLSRWEYTVIALVGVGTGAAAFLCAGWILRMRSLKEFINNVRNRSNR
jgi:O-antigen/teichoic acid export membrane protein